MKLYINNSTDPYFNLAAEEYLTRTADDDIIMLWRNSPAVIIGKNQNAFAELDLEYVREHGIRVVRRMTGGGAVFHDLGNINFTFISPKGGRLAEGIRDGGLDFAYFTAPITDALSKLGLKARLSGRNDIVIDTDDGERKVSGNAQCVLDGTTLHHGTLLFSAKMESLAGALKPDPDKLRSKGIASVKSRVANINDLLTEKGTDIGGVEKFLDYLAENLSLVFSVTPEGLPSEIIDSIRRLTDEKYSTDEWNIGRFGDFTMTRKRRLPCGTVSVALSVENGRISDLRIGGDFFGGHDITELEKMLIGCEYSATEIADILSGIDISGYILGASVAELTEILI